MAKTKMNESDLSKKKNRTKILLSAPAATAALKHSNKYQQTAKPNPFEILWSRKKFNVLGKKRKGEECCIGLAPSLSIEKAMPFSGRRLCRRSTSKAQRRRCLLTRALGRRMMHCKNLTRRSLVFCQSGSSKFHQHREEVTLHYQATQQTGRDEGEASEYHGAKQRTGGGENLSAWRKNINGESQCTYPNHQGPHHVHPAGVVTTLPCAHHLPLKL